MRKLLSLVVFCGLASCGLFESTEKKTQKLVEKELLEIDWTDVDHYPLFSDCDELASKQVQKTCFEEKLLRHLSADLQEFELTSETEIEDVVFLVFRVENDGTLTVITIENKEIFGAQTEKFEKKVVQSLQRLPRIEPALKRGIPVRAKFRIPIFLNSK